MTQTPNLGLALPAPEDWADIETLNANFRKIDDFTSRKDNPHEVTAAQVGAVPTNKVGQPNGVAGLNEQGKIPSAQLPAMDYIPTKEKGQANGVASLGSDGKLASKHIPTAQVMGAEPAGSCTAVEQHLTAHRNDKSNPHGVTPDQIGAQRTLTGTLGQFVGFNASGAAEAQELEVVITGSYVGTRDEFPRGPEKRVIDLGVKPKAVLIIGGYGAIRSDGRESSIDGGLALDGNPAKFLCRIPSGNPENDYAPAISIVDNGFEVIDHVDYGVKWHLNDKRYEYHYIAFL